MGIDHPYSLSLCIYSGKIFQMFSRLVRSILLFLLVTFAVGTLTFTYVSNFALCKANQGKPDLPRVKCETKILQDFRLPRSSSWITWPLLSNQENLHDSYGSSVRTIEPWNKTNNVSFIYLRAGVPQQEYNNILNAQFFTPGDIWREYLHHTVCILILIFILIHAT